MSGSNVSAFLMYKRSKNENVPVVNKKWKKSKQHGKVPSKKVKLETNNSSGAVNKTELNDTKLSVLNQNKKSCKKSSQKQCRLTQSSCSNEENKDNSDITISSFDDSRKNGECAFKWMVHPLELDEFYSTYWEKKEFLIKRNDPYYYEGLFSTMHFDKLLHEHCLRYSKNIDVTSYSNDQRETHNQEGRAFAHVIWDYYKNGCSIRFLNPQTYHKPVWKLLSTLQEYFNSFCGANVYLTPPGTQGFAPHWDDIEAFVLQLEGKKRWRVYAPRSDDEVLPRFSSQNLKQATLNEPVLDTVLEAGDLLYFPKGFIHQGNAVEGTHSLHITVSTYQRNTWADLLNKLIPQAVAIATVEDREFREGLPLESLNYMGLIHQEDNDKRRHVFIQKLSSLINKLIDYAPIDSAIDQIGKKFLQDCLPPFLSEDEKKHSVFGSGTRWNTVNLSGASDSLNLNTPIRLIRGNCVRMISEEQSVVLYYTLENSREYHAEEIQFVELLPEQVSAVEQLINSYPRYIRINDLSINEEEGKQVSPGKDDTCRNGTKNIRVDWCTISINIGFVYKKGIKSHSSEERGTVLPENNKETLTGHQKQLMSRGLPKKKRIPGVENVILVASGKGGVGKSTTAVNLALAISQSVKGSSVGLLDMDIFGPSIPMMMNLQGKAQIDNESNLVPLLNYGIKCMSMGFLMDTKAAAIWRGPMVISAVQNLLLKTAWNNVDYLILDLPPGTGDTPLSISQLVIVSGAVVVSTPQDIALLDAYRGVEMFKKVDIPVLGLVQNMHSFICPKCGHEEYIFGKDGAFKMADEIGVDVLGSIPLSTVIQRCSDSGSPIVIAHPESQQALCFKNIAVKILEKLKK